MAVITEITNVADTFEKLKILLDLERYSDQSTALGAGIVNAIQCKVKPNEIISFVKDQAKDNPSVMADVIGKELCDKILNL